MAFLKLKPFMSKIEEEKYLSEAFFVHENKLKILATVVLQDAQLSESFNYPLTEKQVIIS